jgi:hypothetical protein
MREVKNVTENQIVQVPPNLNIFKDSELLREIKLAADIQDEKEESKKPTKEPVTESGSFYKKIAD